MASTYTLISSQVLASSASSVTFSAIPATYTDLVVKVSSQNDNSAATTASYQIAINSDTATNYSSTVVRGNGATATSISTTSATILLLTFAQNGQFVSTNFFGSGEIYIPSYTASQKKPISFFGVQENNATSNAWIQTTAGLWRNNAAITSLVFTDSAGYNFVTNSSFYLYGISNA